MWRRFHGVWCGLAFVQEWRVMLDHAVEGNARFIGDNLRAVNKVAHNVAKNLTRSTLPSQQRQSPDNQLERSRLLCHEVHVTTAIAQQCASAIRKWRAHFDVQVSVITSPSSGRSETFPLINSFSRSRNVEITICPSPKAASCGSCPRFRRTTKRFASSARW
jgi:hypothetical protein